MSKAIVIGGGVIGLLSAYQLRKRGRDVVIIDKGNLGRGSSSGNAGWVTPSLSGPVPAPGIVSDSIKWMLQPESPLYVKPSAIPKMAGWLISFWRHCSPRHYRRGLIALSRFNETTMQDFDALIKDGLDFEMHRSGLMYVFLDQSTVQSMEQEVKEASEFAPIDWLKLTPDEAREIEPALKPEITGAILIESDRHVRPESLLKAVSAWIAQNGVEIMPHTEVTDLAFEDDRVIGVQTSNGLVRGDQVLIAAGAEAGFLSRRARLNLPMQAGKGYSTTMEMDKPPISRSMYLVESRVALTPFKGAMRIAGTMELSGINTKMHERRIDAMVRNANRYLDLKIGKVVERWVGMRPMLPDGLPAIGRTAAFDNVFIAAGHAMLGVTLGPTTAVAIAELMTTGQSPYDLTAFDPNRFDRR